MTRNEVGAAALRNTLSLPPMRLGVCRGRLGFLMPIRASQVRCRAGAERISDRGLQARGRLSMLSSPHTKRVYYGAGESRRLAAGPEGRQMGKLELAQRLRELAQDEGRMHTEQAAALVRTQQAAIAELKARNDELGAEVRLATRLPSTCAAHVPADARSLRTMLALARRITS